MFQSGDHRHIVLGWGCPSLLSRAPLYIVSVILCSQESKASRVLSAFLEFAPAALVELRTMRNSLQAAINSTKVQDEYTCTVARLLDVKLADHVQELTKAIGDNAPTAFNKAELTKVKKDVVDMVKTASHARAHMCDVHLCGDNR